MSLEFSDGTDNGVALLNRVSANSYEATAKLLNQRLSSRLLINGGAPVCVQNSMVDPISFR